MRLRPLGLLFFPCACAVATFAATDFPAVFNTGENTVAPPMTAQAAVQSLRLPAGFTASVFAAEPDVQNPVAMAWDARGQLWVAENYTYAERSVKFEQGLRDRVLIFSDPKGDGRFSSRRVFADNLQRLTSVEVGMGGVWLMCPPQLLFIPDKDGDGVPDAPATVILDGFTVPSENYHTFANGLRFGPDGWLYGRCGASSPAEIGAPGTPAAARVPMRGTLWRYHPQRKVVEVLSSGTTNPWGHDWDRHGELFFINTVNAHLWHSIPGAHYARGTSVDPNPHAYELIDQHADHAHFDTKQSWMKSRDGAASDFGGGHAHAGVMIYQGDNWPSVYRNQLFTLNFHGRRANMEILERAGSGYVGHHGADFFLSSDPWFRGIDLSSGPDGGVFVLDWSDMGECHNANGINRTSGRIFKIVHDTPRQAPPDLVAAADASLITHLNHPNAWVARQARLQLAARASDRPLPETLTAELRRIIAEKSPDAAPRLRALWALNAVGGAGREVLLPLLRDADEHVRVWAIRLLSDAWPLDTTLGERPSGAPASFEPAILSALESLARSDSSGLVRLTLASTLQRVPLVQRPALAIALGAHAEDANDHNLPLMIWYGLIPLGRTAPAVLAAVAARSEIPTVRRLAARRLAEDVETQPAALDALLASALGQKVAFQSDIITGLAQGLTGWRRAPKPASWEKFRASLPPATPDALRERIRDLDVLFGDGRALDAVVKVALDAQADLAARKSALNALIDARPENLRAICEQLLRVRFINAVAVRGLTLFDGPELGRTLAGAFGQFHPVDRPALINALVSRPAFARALLEAVATGRIPRESMTAFHARQVRSLGDAGLSKLLVAAWGELRDSSEDNQQLITKLKSELTPAMLAQADKGRGRAAFNMLCAACHRLYGEGNLIGPDLTGSGRENLDYLLENIIDPSAVVPADFRMATVAMKDGRTLSGFIAAKTPRTLTLRGMDSTQVIERADIKSIEESNQSLMPEGLLANAAPDTRRDLIAYLMNPTQVPLAAEAK